MIEHTKTYHYASSTKGIKMFTIGTHFMTSLSRIGSDGFSVRTTCVVICLACLNIQSHTSVLSAVKGLTLL